MKTVIVFDILSKYYACRYIKVLTMIPRTAEGLSGPTKDDPASD